MPLVFLEMGKKEMGSCAVACSRSSALFFPLKIFNAIRDLKPELISVIWVPFSLEVCTLLVLLCPAKLLLLFFFLSCSEECC